MTQPIKRRVLPPPYTTLKPTGDQNYLQIFIWRAIFVAVMISVFIGLQELMGNLQFFFFSNWGFYLTTIYYLLASINVFIKSKPGSGFFETMRTTLHLASSAEFLICLFY